MVFLLSSQADANQKFIDLFTTYNIEYTSINWNMVQNVQQGLLFIDEPKITALKLNLLRNLRKYKTKILLLCNEDLSTEMTGNLLALPENTDPMVIKLLIHWMLFQNAAEICTNVLRSFFYKSKYRIFFLNTDDIILYSIPEKKSFLGYNGSYFHNKAFHDIFRIKAGTIPVVGAESDEVFYHITIRNEKIKVKLFKLYYTKNSIPGIPKGTYTIIFLNKQEELPIRNDINILELNKPAARIEQRAIELLVTNEIHQIQTKRLKNAFLQMNKRNKQFMEELSLASDLQKSLLPRDFPSDMPLNFTHKYLPYTFIGGDFFDVIRIDKERIGIMIADVSGHGVSAAFITAMFKSAFSHLKNFYLNPMKLMQALNKEFAETIHTEHYITAFYSVLDVLNMKCLYCNAGHPRQLLFKKNGQILELTTEGFFIGTFENTEYENQEVSLNPGDRLVNFTDGIMEITNSKKQFYGRENIKKTISENWQSNIEGVSDILMSDLVMYMDDIAFTDDITILITEIMENI